MLVSKERWEIVVGKKNCTFCQLLFVFIGHQFNTKIHATKVSKKLKTKQNKERKIVIMLTWSNCVSWAKNGHMTQDLYSVIEPFTILQISHDKQKEV